MSQKKKEEVSTESYPGVVETIVGNADSRGGVNQVRVKVLAGPDTNKIITRNVRGPVKVGDILVMTETEFEARKIVKKNKDKSRKW